MVFEQEEEEEEDAPRDACTNDDASLPPVVKVVVIVLFLSRYKCKESNALFFTEVFCRPTSNLNPKE